MPAWSGLWDGVFTGGHSLLVNKDNLRNLVANMMRKKGMAKDRELITTLLGAAAGDTASLTMKRVAAVAGGDNLGGVRTVETETIINRATTSADVTALNDYLSNINDRVPTYPGDLSGNGK